MWRAILGGAITLGVLAGLAVSTLAAFDPARFDTGRTVTSRPPEAQPLTVLDVLSGDTIVVSSDSPGNQVPRWGTITAKLIGVDSPNFGIIDECYAVEAQARLSALLPEGSVAWGTVDVEPKDDNGRWLMYLWTADGRFVNYELTVDGFAPASRMPPNDSLWKVIEAGQTQAVARLWGIWSECRL